MQNYTQKMEDYKKRASARQFSYLENTNNNTNITLITHSYDTANCPATKANDGTSICEYYQSENRHGIARQLTSTDLTTLDAHARPYYE